MHSVRVYDITHTFNGPLSGTTRVSRYQKGKTNLDFTEARDSVWQWHQLGHMQSAPCSRQITVPAPHHSVFYNQQCQSTTSLFTNTHGRHGVTSMTSYCLYTSRR